MNNSIDAVFFDLDGTLLDTAPDLAFALNSVLVEQQRPPLLFATIRPWVSFGARTLIKFGFQITDNEDPQLEPLRQRFLQIYAANLATHTCLFPGMEEVLTTLEGWQMPWGIVTNKPKWLTQPLLEQLGLATRSVCNVSGDTLPVNKPHPAPLLHACQVAKCVPERCLYVGDALRDIEAGQRAGMQTVVALYGYIGQEEKPGEWGATRMIRQPGELLELLQGSG
jgi:N-acetyl-D-muramate 6-phosphate phosphatase